MTMKKQALFEDLIGSGVAGPIAGLATGLPVGRSLAGATASEVAPYGKMTKSEDVARKAALIGAPALGVTALILSRKYGLPAKAAETVARMFPKGAIMDPLMERKVVEEIVPLLAALGGSAAGGVATGAATGGIAHLLPNPRGKKEDSEKTSSIDKLAFLEKVLDYSWMNYGESAAIEKNAAAHYFHTIRKPTLDAEALGTKFCKVAGVLKVDPWVLACSVELNLPAFEVLAKTASGTPQQLAQFYVDWTDYMLEKNAFLGKLLTKGREAAGAVKNFFTGAKPKLPGVGGGAKPPVIHGAPPPASGVAPPIKGPPPAAPAPGAAPAPSTAPAAPPMGQGPKGPTRKFERKQMAQQENLRRQANMEAAQTRQAERAQRVETQRQNVMKNTAPGMVQPSNTRGGTEQLKKNLLAKHQADPRLQEMRQAGGRAPVAKGGYTTGEKLMGGAALLGTGGAAYGAMGGMNPQPQAAY